jgi:hypothetical protein
MSVQDITPEKTGMMLADHGELLLFSDEGGIFETIAGRYSNQVPNLDLILQAHSGSKAKVDRTSREKLDLECPLLCIALSPQPSIANVLRKTTAFRDRGFVARFLMAWPESNLGERKLEPNPTPQDVQVAYEMRMRELLERPRPQTPHLLHLTPDAHAMWKHYARVIEGQMKPGGRLAQATDVASKMQGQVLRLAAILHLVDHAPEFPINPEVMARAMMLADFYIDHALIGLGMIGADPALQVATRLWQEIEPFILRSCEAVPAREIWLPTRSEIKTIADAEVGFQLLLKRRWIREMQHPPGKRGRPSRTFEINPEFLFAHCAHGFLCRN